MEPSESDKTSGKKTTKQIHQSHQESHEESHKESREETQEESKEAETTNAPRKEHYTEAGKLQAKEIDFSEKHTSDVHFHINYKTSFGESIWVCGNHEKIGNWNPQHAFKLEWSEGNIWKGTLPIEKDKVGTLEYKYICKKGNNLKWEFGPNHFLMIEGIIEDQMTKNDNWQT
ncbi:unnamed protein product [Blepharisma stoltei]|uniref:CBM20 domain-containing protein n=1 Tax=Blepharisma stoltei TaxID=1481888 RepID=A0AAU9KJB9_9CILI|nr:unnamed protein product [Blepharisma stoltei]